MKYALSLCILFSFSSFTLLKAQVRIGLKAGFLGAGYSINTLYAASRSIADGSNPGAFTQFPIDRSQLSSWDHGLTMGFGVRTKVGVNILSFGLDQFWGFKNVDLRNISQNRTRSFTIGISQYLKAT